MNNVDNDIKTAFNDTNKSVSSDLRNFLYFVLSIIFVCYFSITIIQQHTYNNQLIYQISQTIK